jgi:hypothetical protein
MRYYCSGRAKVPHIIWLALETLSDNPPDRQ